MKYELKSILALVPQNNEGEQIFNQAVFFQKALDMRLFVLNILKPSNVFFQNLRVRKIEQKKETATKELTVFIENILKKDIRKNIIPFILVGNDVPLLIRQSKKGGYEFLIIDKSEPDYEGDLTKSKILKIIGKAHCPVLTVNKNYPVHSIKKIIVPIDISQSTKKRLLWATLFAKTFNAKIQIVSALNVDINETKSLAFRNADKIKEMLVKRNVECDIKVLKVHQQDTQKAILNYIENENPDLVIIRTHQDSILSGSKIGKFVEEIVFGCKMPVLTVNYGTKTISN